MSFGRIETQAGFGQNVLTGFKSGQSHGTVKVRPGTDNHGIDIRVSNEILPMLKRFRDAMLSSNGSRRLGPSIADRDDFDIGNRSKPGNMPGFHVSAGAD